uniref:Uncharacterized protein n=1 Tax=Anguilla anguilla TaxID=7936 RepID=A0A0E9TNX9_ANGAN
MSTSTCRPTPPSVHSYSSSPSPSTLCLRAWQLASSPRSPR